MNAIAWHGTPHTVDKFSTDKIGTGEGAQVYGYGLYFAGNRDVAEYYRKDISNNAELKNKYITLDSEFKRIAADNAKVFSSAIDEYKTKERVVAQIDRSRRVGVGAKHHYDVAISWVNSLSDKDVKILINESRKGNLYQVELAPNEDEYLLWDKPLKNQSALVRRAIEKNAERFNYPTKNMIGASIHNAVRDLSSDKEAADFLHSLGIRGIKYLDGSSRSSGDGSYNYVIFSDDDVKMLQRL